MEASARARLVEDHLDVAHRIAATIYPRVRGYIEFDELVALGNAGLAEAAARFDPERGVAFTTFAYYRIQGTIIDGLRRMSQLPRRVWAKLVALRAASDYLEQRGERDRGATATGAPAATGAETLAQVSSAIAAIKTMYMTSLEAMREEGFDAAGPAPELPAQIDEGRRGERIRAAVRALPEKQRALMTLHYWEGKNLLEAGEALGISKSWASRLHAQAVERLREVVEDDPGP